MGFSHVELLPPSEYPYGASWGYQVTGYYAPTYRYGTPEEFAVMVAAIKKAGIGVLIDWVPAHFPADEFALARFDGTCLFEHENPKQGHHAEWGTLCQLWPTGGRSFDRSAGMAGSFGVDGLCRYGASILYWLWQKGWGMDSKPIGRESKFGNNRIIGSLIAIHEGILTQLALRRNHRLSQITHFRRRRFGLDFKWNMGWMHDVLRRFSASPNERPNSHDNLTFERCINSLKNLFSLSHDEVVHEGSLADKSIGEHAERLANLWAHTQRTWRKDALHGLRIRSMRVDFESPGDFYLATPFMVVKPVGADLNALYLVSNLVEIGHKSDKFSGLIVTVEGADAIVFEIW